MKASTSIKLVKRGRKGYRFQDEEDIDSDSFGAALDSGVILVLWWWWKSRLRQRYVTGWRSVLNFGETEELLLIRWQNDDQSNYTWVDMFRATAACRVAFVFSLC